MPQVSIVRPGNLTAGVENSEKAPSIQILLGLGGVLSELVTIQE